MSNQRKEHKQNESFKKYYGKYESYEHDEYGKSPTNVNEYVITEKSTSISTISNAYEQWPKSTSDFKSDDGQFKSPTETTTGTNGKTVRNQVTTDKPLL